MKSAARFLTFAATCAAVAYGAYLLAFPQYTHRFWVTINIDDNGTPKAGSGIITVTDQNVNALLVNQKAWNVSARGPAPWVDLGNKGIIAVAVHAHYPVEYEPLPYSGEWLSFVAYFGAKHHDPKNTKANIDAISQQIGSRQLRTDQMPEFIWIADPNDPASARLVPPDQFSEVIGPGIQLSSVSVEITNEGADNSLYEKLPWLSAMERDHYWNLKFVPARFKLNATNLLGDLHPF